MNEPGPGQFIFFHRRSFAAPSRGVGVGGGFRKTTLNTWTSAAAVSRKQPGPGSQLVRNFPISFFHTKTDTHTVRHTYSLTPSGVAACLRFYLYFFHSRRTTRGWWKVGGGGFVGGKMRWGRFGLSVWAVRCERAIYSTGLCRRTSSSSSSPRLAESGFNIGRQKKGKKGNFMMPEE